MLPMQTKKHNNNVTEYQKWLLYDSSIMDGKVVLQILYNKILSWRRIKSQLDIKLGDEVFDDLANLKSKSVTRKFLMKTCIAHVFNTLIKKLIAHV